MATFLRKSMELFTGNLIAQFIAMSTMPLVTRLFTPAEFGIFAMFISSTAVLAPVSTLRFNEVIILPETIEEGLNVFVLSCLATAGVSLLILAGITIFSMFPSLAVTFHLEPYLSYLFFLPLAVLIRGISLNMGSFSIRQSKFKILAISSVVTKTFERVVTIALGFLTNIQAWGLIAGRITGVTSSIFYQFWYEIKPLMPIIRRSVTLSEMGRLASHYREFPLYGPWSVFIHTSAQEIVVFLLVSFFSPATAGAYALGRNMINAPLTMISSSLNRVFTQQLASVRNNPEALAAETKTLVTSLTTLMLPPVLVLTIMGDHLFMLVFGQSWQLAGTYVQILAPSFFFVFLYTILRAFFIVFEQPKPRLFFDVCYICSRIVPLLLATLLGGNGAIALFVMSMTTCLFVMIFLLFIGRIIGLNLVWFVPIIAKNFLYTSPLFAFLIIARQWYSSSVTTGLAFLFVGLIVQAGIILHREPVVKERLYTLAVTFFQRRKNR